MRKHNVLPCRNTLTAVFGCRKGSLKNVRIHADRGDSICQTFCDAKLVDARFRRQLARGYDVFFGNALESNIRQALCQLIATLIRSVPLTVPIAPTTTITALIEITTDAVVMIGESFFRMLPVTLVLKYRFVVQLPALFPATALA